jgi:phage-related protein
MKKDVIFVGTSRNDLRDFGEKVAKEIGTELMAIQMGFEPGDWKPMPSIGSNVKEIRTHQENEYRTIYIAKFTEAIYVLHSFEKKSRKTAKKDIDLAKDRLKAVIASRKKKV